jgi:putative tricarboxylic transport membrane protein
LRRAHQIAAFCFVIFSAAVVWGSFSLEYYTKLGPGAGFFPFWLGVVMGTLSVIWFVQLSAARVQHSIAVPDRAGIVRIVAIVGSLTVATLLMNLLGFQVVMFLLLVFLLMALGRQPLWLTVVIALAGSVGVYRVFVGYLDVQLPVASLASLAGLGL